MKTYDEKKLLTLANIEGYETVDELVEAEIENDYCGTMPGMAAICMNHGCDYSVRTEVDGGGWCENCQEQTVEPWTELVGLGI